MLEIDFSEPKLEVLYNIQNAVNTKDFAQIEKYLVETGAVDLYKQMVDMGLIKYKAGVFKKIEVNKEQIIVDLQSKHSDELDEENKIKKFAEFYANAFDLTNFDVKVKELLEINQTTSLQLDIQFCRIRIALILGDKKMLHENIEKANHISAIADWDRKNRYKVYLGIYELQKANFEQAAVYLFESLASFEATEMLQFNQIILYLVFSGLLSFSRRDVETKMANNFEVLKFKEVSELVEIFFNCEYSSLFESLIRFAELTKNDVFIGEYTDFFVKEMMFKGYQQFLFSYQSVDLQKMAQTFKVSTKFLEEDLRGFIIAQRLNCEIDKVDSLINVKGLECDVSYEKELAKAEEILKMVRKATNK